MLLHKTFKLILLSASIAFLLNGCGALPAGPPSSRESSASSSQEVLQEPSVLQPPSSEQTEQKPDGSFFPVSIFAPKTATDAREVKLDPADIEFVQHRLEEYKGKFENWLGISTITRGGELAEEITTPEKECNQKLARILNGYSLLLERMQQSDTIDFDKIATVDPKKMQQLDIAFLESGCDELLAADIAPQYEFVPETKSKLSFTAALESIALFVEQETYQEAIFAYESLARNFPAQKPFLSTQLDYGLALQYSGQIEAAAKHFNNMLVSGDLSIEPLSLQREIADLLLASGNVAAAESYYDTVISGHETIRTDKTWAEEQLVFLRSVDLESEEMGAYMKLLRQFQIYDYRIHAFRLNEAINAFTIRYTGRPVAVSALRLKSFALGQLKSWFNRQLVTIDSLVAKKNFAAAINILENMTRYYLPADLQAVLQETHDEIIQAKIVDTENQQLLQEVELSVQWEAATNLLDSQRYDLAIPAFTALMGTEYEEKANMMITETANQAAGQMRKDAASLFVRAGKTSNLEQKKELLLASHGLLNEILTRYPQTDLLEKVRQNIAILEIQMQRFGPAPPEEPQWENPAALPVEPQEPYTRQLQ